MAGVAARRCDGVCVPRRSLPYPRSHPHPCTLAAPPSPTVPPAQLLWSEGGVRRFYRGFTPCIARAAPANGIMLYTVDKVSQLLNKH